MGLKIRAVLDVKENTLSLYKLDENGKVVEQENYVLSSYLVINDGA
jgi:hypothetical protein